MAFYDLADFTSRITKLLPQSWFSDGALKPGGNTYALMNSLAVPLQTSKEQIDYVGLQKRLLTATDTNLEAIANDFFGPGGFPRGTVLVNGNFQAETDASYALRIQQAVIAGRNTLYAIQTRVQSYLNDFYQASEALNAQLLGADSAGGIDSYGALDGRPQDVPELPTVVCFDIQSNPKMAAKVGLTSGQFCVLFSYGGLTQSGFFLGRSHVSRETGGGTMLLNPVIRVLPGPLTPSVGALVNSIKATGFQPVYADNRVS
jgi:hypothetical protein